jgi:hypothetical protein
MIALRVAIGVGLVAVATVFAFALFKSPPPRTSASWTESFSRPSPTSRRVTSARAIPTETRARAESMPVKAPPVESGPVREIKVVGRLVTDVDREPVVGGIALVGAVNPRGGVRWSTRESDQGGRFDCSVPARDLAALRIEVRNHRNAGVRFHEISGPFRKREIDVGDLALAAFKTIWFRVQKSDGHPLEGALVGPATGDAWTFEKTDATGHGSIDLAPDASGLNAVADGYDRATVGLRPGEESVVIRLERASTLTIRVATAAGPASPATTTIRVAAERGPWALDPGDPLWSELGNTTPERLDKGGAIYRGNFVRLSPVRSGERIVITVAEQSSGAESQQEVVVGAREAKVVEIMLKGSFARLFGRVVDAFDKPIQGATVMLGDRDLSRTSNARGEFDFGAVAADLADLRVSAQKHAFWRAGDFRLRADQGPMTIRLEEGASLQVRVLGRDDGSVKGASVYALDRFAITAADGIVVLPHLPRERVSVEVFFQGAGSRHEHDVAHGAATIRIDATPK